MSVDISNGTDCVNMCNANAALVLGALGLEAVNEFGELCGSSDAADVLGRCLTFIAVGEASREDVNEGRMFQFGLSADEVRVRVQAIADIASGALARGEQVHWA